MELQFTKNTDGVYEASFKMNSDANVHIEASGNAPILVLQRGTSTGTYARSQVIETRNNTFDFDVNALVYPKWVKLETANSISSAVVTGDVTE